MSVVQYASIEAQIHCKDNLFCYGRNLRS